MRFCAALCFVLFCGWIPLHAEGGILGFLCFAGCFLLCFISRSILFIRREKAEKQQLAEALRQYRSV